MKTLYEYVINGLTFSSNKYKIGINNNAQFQRGSLGIPKLYYWKPQSLLI